MPLSLFVSQSLIEHDSYISWWLSQGVPSLFSDLSSLYDHPRKVNFPALSLRILSQISLYLASLCFTVFLFVYFVTQPDILEQLLIEMENSIRTTGSYPGRYTTELFMKFLFYTKLTVKCYQINDLLNHLLWLILNWCSDVKEPPSTLLWTLFFLAQVHCCYLSEFLTITNNFRLYFCIFNHDTHFS